MIWNQQSKEQQETLPHQAKASPCNTILEQNDYLILLSPLAGNSVNIVISATKIISNYKLLQYYVSLELLELNIFSPYRTSIRDTIGRGLEVLLLYLFLMLRQARWNT